MAEEEILFYSCLDSGSNKSPTTTHCEDFIEQNKEIVFPCIILIRNNGWNDHGCFSHFRVFYLPEKNNVNSWGTVCIIQSNAPYGKTTLPYQFNNLPKNEFFSRGKLTFYNSFESLGNLKSKVLSALNDVHFNHYSQEDIVKIDPELELPYSESLFREGFSGSDVSSKYAKDSLDMLDKISSCLESISTLGEDEQEIMKRLLFGSAIASLESYLGDAFKYHILNKEEYYFSFLKNYDFDREKNYSLNELGRQKVKMDDFLMNKVKEHLNNIIFHKVDLVTKLYIDILNVDLQSSLRDFRDSIQKRHDIFHRNGKDLSGEELKMRSQEVRDLVSNIKRFVTETEKIMMAQTS